MKLISLLVLSLLTVFTLKGCNGAGCKAEQIVDESTGRRKHTVISGSKDCPDRKRPNCGTIPPLDVGGAGVTINLPCVCTDASCDAVIGGKEEEARLPRHKKGSTFECKPGLLETAEKQGRCVAKTCVDGYEHDPEVAARDPLSPVVCKCEASACPLAPHAASMKCDTSLNRCVVKDCVAGYEKDSEVSPAVCKWRCTSSKCKTDVRYIEDYQSEKVMDMECVANECVYVCARGYTLVDKKCVKVTATVLARTQYENVYNDEHYVKPRTEASPWDYYRDSNIIVAAFVLLGFAFVLIMCCFVSFVCGVIGMIFGFKIQTNKTKKSVFNNVSDNSELIV